MFTASSVQFITVAAMSMDIKVSRQADTRSVFIRPSLIVQLLTRFQLARPRRAVPQRQLGFLYLPRELCSRGICYGRVSVCVSVCHKSVFIKMAKHVGKRKQRHTIAHGL